MTLRTILMIAGLCLVLIFGGIRYLDTSTSKISYRQGETFMVPKSCKKLALLGCTIHPTSYLEKTSHHKHMRDLTLEDLCDMEDLKDSFVQVLDLCKQRKVDHLLIAYLPIYFVKMQELMGADFIEQCHVFLTSIAPQVVRFIDTIMQTEHCVVPITLIIPTRKSLKHVPQGTLSQEDRVRFSVKGLPKIILGDTLEILIINNKNASQNEDIIRYLRYE